MPRFSLVIPTLRRPDTLRYALLTAINQRYDDFEVIVQNNGNDAATRAVISEFGHPRIRCCASDTVVPMTANWENALDNSDGEFITFIGDDDGLFPDAAALADHLIDQTGLDLVSWRPYCYYWPNYIHAEFRNRLIAEVDYELAAEILSGEDLLKRFYRFDLHYARLPMIYNSFVKRRVIDEIRGELGRYFLGSAPDVTSGIVNAAQVRRFVAVTRPLSLTGLSGHSTGHNLFLSRRGHALTPEVAREQGIVATDNRLPKSGNLQIYLANEMLLVRERWLKQWPPVELDFHRLTESVAASINDRPGYYGETLAAVQSLAERHGVDLAQISVPARVDRASPTPIGVMPTGPRSVRFVVDGDAVRLANVADAVRLMEQFAPRWDAGTALDIREAQAGAVLLRPGEHLTFSSAGNGSASLEAGWGEAEAWGTWSVGNSASIRLGIAGGGGQTLRLDLSYRVFVHSMQPTLAFACSVAGTRIAAWTCAIGNDRGVLTLPVPSALIADDGTFVLTFSIGDPRSPAELGLSPDTRRLGIGIEALHFVE
jgi:glycosyltransferase involved in cell wall biosynthesis